ncbi:MAG: hypothetical protein AAGC46_04765 [Solirubrobacteraceae bacterium]|nr:hypothetical protein [Patulibacter sp.]
MTTAALLSAATATAHAADAPDTELPTRPGTPTVTGTTDVGKGVTRYAFTWTPATDNVGVTRYEVVDSSGGVIASRGPDDRAFTTDVLPDGGYNFSVQAVDAAGNVSATSAATAKDGYFQIPDNGTPPNAPGIPVRRGVSPDGVVVSWAPSNFNYLRAPSYDLYDGDTKIVSGIYAISSYTLPPSYTATSPYALSVVAVDVYGHRSAPSPVLTYPESTTPTPTPTPIPPTPTPTPQPTIFTEVFLLDGATTLKTLAKGAIPTTGRLNISRTIVSDDIDAQVELESASARLTVLGVLPVVAQIGFVSTQTAMWGLPATGTWQNRATGQLSLTTQARIRVVSASIFGVKLVQTATCQTAQPSRISLASAGAVTPTTGGTLAGTFSIGNLAGCGSLTGLVSPLVAGGGNALALHLVAPTQA